MQWGLLKLTVLLVALTWVRGQYQPTWDSLDARPLPAWFDQAKIGIFIHWGVFSVPSFASEWFWHQWQTDNQSSVVEFMKNNYRPDFTYADFASQFTAEFFDPDQWAAVLQKSGAKYVVLTSKHHEGFTLWPSKRAFSWNAVDVGPKRDLVGDLARSVRNLTDLHFGLYHSLFEWYNPLHLNDLANNRSDFVTGKTLPELVEIVNAYQPEVIWSDGDWTAGPEYWRSREFLAWLYNHSPVKDTVVTNDRWGIGTGCKHGGYYSCADRYDPGVLQAHKWENAFTIDRQSWGYRREARLDDFLSIHDILVTIVRAVSCGGNALVNIGPTHDGRIVPIFEERLTQMGEWLAINGEAIYHSRPWKVQNDTLVPYVWYTSRGDNVYALVLQWPEDDVLKLGAGSDLPSSCQMLGYNGPLDCTDGQVSFPNMELVQSKWAWVIKFSPPAEDNVIKDI